MSEIIRFTAGSIWNGDLSTMQASRRNFLGAATSAIAAAMVPLGCTATAASPPLGAITPELFGAKGDGVTNDTHALAAMADYVSARGGGEIWFREATYLVGLQTQAHDTGGHYAFLPDKVMEFSACSRPLVIHGSGARIKCAGGLRFGTFDPRTGQATRHRQPFYGRGESSTPYHWMIKVEDCTGPLEVSDLELDGSLTDLVIGGPWGDTGHQIGAFGIGLYNNRGGETLRNIHTHHHALDGLVIDGLDRGPNFLSVIEGVRSEYNARQGCSVVGGAGYLFVNCRFNKTGKAGLESAPGGGVDIEAEAKQVRHLMFMNCEFSDNGGPGLVADQGDSENASFTGCTFIGTTNWAAWPRKPGFRFVGCTFVGPIVNAYGDVKNPGKAARFSDCTFTDDPTLSPTGRLFIGQNQDGPIADLPASENALFERCVFSAMHDHVLPWSTNKVRYVDCTMRQQSRRIAYPRGTFLGNNLINGHVDLYGSFILGSLTLNGVVQPRSL